MHCLNLPESRLLITLIRVYCSAAVYFICLSHIFYLSAFFINTHKWPCYDLHFCPYLPQALYYWSTRANFTCNMRIGIMFCTVGESYLLGNLSEIKWLFPSLIQRLIICKMMKLLILWPLVFALFLTRGWNTGAGYVCLPSRSLFLLNVYPGCQIGVSCAMIVVRLVL